jgi:hypothetical protein
MYVYVYVSMYIFLVLCVGGWGGVSYFYVCFVCVGLVGCLNVHTCMYTYYTYIYIQTYIHVNIYICLYIYIYTYICVCVCVYALWGGCCHIYIICMLCVGG